MPSTVIALHRRGWRLYWRWKSRPGKGGRPGTPFTSIDLIRRIPHDNPLCGAPCIHGELLMLDIKVSEPTVAKYMIKRGKRPSQNWQTFIRNHLPDIVALNFLTVLTVTFGPLYVLILLSHNRRKVIHFNVTDAPSAYRLDVWPDRSADDFLTLVSYTQIRQLPFRLDLFYVLKHDSSGKIAGETGTGNLLSHTVGVQADGAACAVLDAGATFAAQFGRYGRDALRAFGASGRLGVTAPIAGKPRFGAQYT